LWRTLMQLQDNTDALREYDLKQLDPANQALQKEIWALQDQKAAADEAARSTQALADAWKSITDNMLSQVDAIRGSMAQDSVQPYAALQSRFAIATAQARAGDKTAAENLPQYASDLAGVGSDQFASLAQMMQARAQVAESLATTANLLNGAPAGGETPLQAQQRTAERIASLTQEVKTLQGQMAAIQSNTRRTADAVNGNSEQPMVVEVS